MNDNLPHFKFYCKTIKETQKSGLGSSASVTVALTGLLLRLLSIAPLNEHQWKKQVLTIALEAHSRFQQKIGSGFDIVCAVYGSCVFSRQSLQVFLFAQYQLSFPMDIIAMPDKYDVLLVTICIEGDIKVKGAKTTSMVNLLQNWKHANPESICYLENC